ncbi:carboxylesterase family protein [Dyadobacter pollutisoli]|uniref:Phospholipase n=1 Tax=Dyadobacter pollutisoli TaxID=2910158 RepID=A0A9E8NEF2_9BACT|nr:phospholipase [Dyadobacter pollutisoli]WAC15244.1 phospholipase [Dyadobacter pollutisoli]
MLKSVLSRDFYSFATLFTALLIVSGIFQGIIVLGLGSRTLTVGAFYPWLLVYAFIFVVASFASLQYFWYKSYKAAFVFGLISAVVNLWQYILIYNILLFRSLQQIYIGSCVVLLSVGILSGLSLIFSNANEKPLLKWAGVVSVILGPVLLVTMLWSVNTLDVPFRTLLEKIHRGVSILGVLAPILFLLNLRSESKLLTDTGEKTPPIVWRELAKVLAILGMLFFGTMFAGESVRSGSHRAYVPTPFEKKQAEAFGARNYVNGNGDTLRYRLITPIDYDSTKQYPLVVCLHHGGAHGTDNVRQLTADPAPFLSNDTNREKYPAFIFMPQCPEGYGFGGIDGYPTIDTLVFNAIKSIEKQYLIDAKRRYVIGISGGGYGSWHFISTHPEMFAAAIPICGGGHARYGKALVNMPIWAFHGARDRLAPVSGTREIIHAIEKAGGKPKYSEFAYAGHDIWNDVRDAPGLLDWLFAQKRK